MNVTCKKYGWVHHLLSCEEAQASVDEFNAYYATLDPKTQDEWYHGRMASMQQYERCFNCGSSSPMRWSEPGDCPDGCTIQPTILGPEY